MEEKIVVSPKTLSYLDVWSANFFWSMMVLLCLSSDIHGHGVCDCCCIMNRVGATDACMFVASAQGIGRTLDTK